MSDVFDSYSPLKLSVVKSGDYVRVYAQNIGKNIIIIKRMCLWGESAGGSQIVVSVREGGLLDFYVGGERLEQGLSQLKFEIAWPHVVRARAGAEYIEVTGRSTSEYASFP